MKKIIALLLVALMLSTAVFAEDIILIAPNPNAAKTAELQVIGPEGQLLHVTPALGENATALSVLQEALKEANISCAVAESSYGGSYVSAINGLGAGAYGGYEGWMYYVDGVSPLVGIGSYELVGGEFIQVIYADFDLLVPVVEATRDHKGLVTLSVSADVTTYDENWNTTVTRQPVAGAKLTVDGAEYVTDAQGKAVLSAGDSAKAAVSVQAAKLTEVGLPALLPLHSGFTVDLAAAKTQMPFSDLEEGKWYTPYALEMYDLGVINGLPGGLFGPTGTVTRAQVAKVLFELGGGVPVNYLMTFTDVAETAWYAEAVRWCAAMGIAQGSEGKFSPDAPVTRQDLAVMLMRYQTNVVKADLPATAEAPAFLDNEQIASYAAEAVYKLQKAGIVQGSEGKFSPTATATRGELCKMLSGLVVSD